MRDPSISVPRHFIALIPLCLLENGLVTKEFKGSGGNAEKARLDLKKQVYKYVLNKERVKDLETSHPELVQKARKFKAEVKAEGITGKAKDIFNKARDAVSASSIEGQERRKGGEASAGLLEESVD